MFDTRWHIKIEPLLKGDEFGYIATMENEERFDKMGWKEQGIFIFGFLKFLEEINKSPQLKTDLIAMAFGFDEEGAKTIIEEYQKATKKEQKC